MKREKHTIKYIFINPNTPEETVELLQRIIVDKLLRKYPFVPEQRITFGNENNSD